MSNPLKKTMVYLGLADEEFENENQQASTPASASASAPVVHAAPAPAPQDRCSGDPAATEPRPTEHPAGGDERDPDRPPASIP